MFSENQLNRASIAGINQFALEVAKEYPNLGFGKELKKHFDLGIIDSMVTERRKKQEKAQPQKFWMGGGFSMALAFGTLDVAYSRADDQNKRILYELFTHRLEESDVHITDTVKEDVRRSCILVYKDDEVVA